MIDKKNREKNDFIALGMSHQPNEQFCPLIEVYLSFFILLSWKGERKRHWMWWKERFFSVLLHLSLPLNQDARSTHFLLQCQERGSIEQSISSFAHHCDLRLTTQKAILVSKSFFSSSVALWHCVFWDEEMQWCHRNDSLERKTERKSKEKKTREKERRRTEEVWSCFNRTIFTRR